LFDANELGESFWQDFQAADLILTNRSPNRHDAYKILALQLHDRQKNLDGPSVVAFVLRSIGSLAFRGATTLA
jgi:hypothetical protein